MTKIICRNGFVNTSSIFFLNQNYMKAAYSRSEHLMTNLIATLNNSWIYRVIDTISCFVFLCATLNNNTMSAHACLYIKYAFISSIIKHILSIRGFQRVILIYSYICTHREQTLEQTSRVVVDFGGHEAHITSLVWTTMCRTEKQAVSESNACHLDLIAIIIQLYMLISRCTNYTNI